MTSRIDEIKARLEKAPTSCPVCGHLGSLVDPTTVSFAPAASRDDLAYCLREIEKLTAENARLLARCTELANESRERMEAALEVGDE